MRWLGRALVSIVAGLLVGHLWFNRSLECGQWLSLHLPHANDYERFWLWRVIYASIGTILVFAPACTTVMAVYAISCRSTSRATDKQHTRCRRCDYILRGITEPRCPECGERI